MARTAENREPLEWPFLMHPRKGFVSAREVYKDKKYEERMEMIGDATRSNYEQLNASADRVRHQVLD